MCVCVCDYTEVDLIVIVHHTQRGIVARLSLSGADTGFRKGGGPGNC